MVTARYNTDEELIQLANQVNNWGRWGNGDQLGTINYINDTKVLHSKSLIETGKTISLAHRSKVSRLDEHNEIKVEEYKLQMDSDVGYCSDFVGMVFHGLNFTHLDGLSHVFTKDNNLFNGYNKDELTVEGALKLGVEHMASRGIVSRGVLLDIPLLKGRTLEPGDIIYLEDLLKVESMEGVKVDTGDILFVRTGSNNSLESMSGMHPECLELFHDRQISILGNDGGSDYYPNKSKEFLLPIHEIGIPYMGMPLIDNAKLDTISEYCKEINRYEFFVVIAPWNLVGVTGSLINPLAIF